MEFPEFGQPDWDDPIFAAPELGDQHFGVETEQEPVEATRSQVVSYLLSQPLPLPSSTSTAAAAGVTVRTGTTLVPPSTRTKTVYLFPKQRDTDLLTTSEESGRVMTGMALVALPQGQTWYRLGKPVSLTPTVTLAAYVTRHVNKRTEFFSVSDDTSTGKKIASLLPNRAANKRTDINGAPICFLCTGLDKPLVFEIRNFYYQPTNPKWLSPPMGFIRRISQDLFEVAANRQNIGSAVVSWKLSLWIPLTSSFATIELPVKSKHVIKKPFHDYGRPIGSTVPSSPSVEQMLQQLLPAESIIAEPAPKRRKMDESNTPSAVDNSDPEPTRSTSGSATVPELLKIIHDAVSERGIELTEYQMGIIEKIVEESLARRKDQARLR